jgi:DHA1 family bicyclomycin/chloramphenicol resistance-like MFS transporter
MPVSPPRTAIVLGLLTAVGPVAIDMYLPALPAISRDLGVGTDAVQGSLMAFLMVLGLGQLISGPLSDMFGRKRPLYVGLSIFIAGSIGCALAPSIGTLIAFRVLQGIGACGVTVIPRAVVRDLHTGPDAARLMSLLLSVYSVSPILAPLAGSFITDAVGWRGVFLVVGLLAALAIVLVRTMLTETRPPSARLQSSLAGALSAYRVVLGDRHIIVLALISSLTLAGFFLYVANSSFVLTAHFGASPRLYAMLFAFNAVAFVGAAQFNAGLATRFGARAAVRMAVVGYAATMLLLLALTWAGVDRLDVLVALLFIGFGFAGVIVPLTFVLAMAGNPAIAGTASALLGTLNFAGGAVVVAVLAPFADGTPFPMVAGIATCAVIVFVVALLALRHQPPTAVAAAQPHA